MKTEDHRTLWSRTARRLARRMNFGFWLAGFLPLLFAVGLGQSFALVLLRRNELGTGLSWLVFAVLLASAALWAWSRQRARFFSHRDALVYLESRLGLHNALTAAEDGVTEWPKRRPLPERILPAWSWQRIAPWPAWTLGMIALAVWLPLTPATSSAPHTPVEPTAWSGIDSWIETLEESDVLEEESLETFREQVESLRRQDPQEWYDHSTLEASDALRQRTENAIRDLQENLQKASQTLNMAGEYPDGLPSGWGPELREELENAIDGLQNGQLRLDPELLARLAEIDIENLPRMSEDELDDLRACLADGLGACLAAGFGAGGPGAGRGGIGRGPGAAPLTFREEAAGDRVSRFESASNDDLSRAALGDRIGVGEAEIPDDPTPYTGPSAAGAVTSPGTGGEAVAREDYTPDEQAVLERYFE